MSGHIVISTKVPSFMSINERELLIETLENCFKKTTLETVPFYLALRDGIPRITNGSYDDMRMSSMVRSYRYPEDREMLKSVFTRLEEEYASDLEEFIFVDVEPRYAETGYAEVVSGLADLAISEQEAISEPEAVELDDIIPDLERHSFDNEFLESVTQGRFNVLDAYFEELLESKMRYAHPRLKYRSNVERLRRKLKHVNDQTNTLVSLSIQASEERNDKVTEVGICIYDPAKDCVSLHPSLKTIHILIKENLHLRNGGFIDDNRGNFLSGDSMILPHSQATDLVQCLIDYYFIRRSETRDMGAVFVGHNFPRMIRYLATLGIEIPRKTILIDTRMVYGLTHGKSGASLGSLLKRFGIPHLHMSNAGNSAYYTLELLMKMADPQWRRWKRIDFIGEFSFVTQRKRELRAREWEGDVFEGTTPEPASMNKKEIDMENVPPREFHSWIDALEWVLASADQ